MKRLWHKFKLFWSEYKTYFFIALLIATTFRPDYIWPWAGLSLMIIVLASSNIVDAKFIAKQHELITKQNDLTAVILKENANLVSQVATATLEKISTDEGQHYDA